MRFVSAVALLGALSANAADAPHFCPHSDECIAGTGFAVAADRRVFAVMAFMNAMGFEDEAKDATMHPARVKAREWMAVRLAQIPEKAAAWKKQYAEWRAPSFVYQDLSLGMSAEYPFAFVRPSNETAYPVPARRMQELPKVLNDFWNGVELGKLWEELKPQYMAAVRRYSLERMTKERDFVWTYLRMPPRATGTIVTVPNLLDKHYSAIAARYAGAFFAVESPGAGDDGLNVHEYLHFTVNPIVKANFAQFRHKLEARTNEVKGTPMAKIYGTAETYVSECLVRALDKRIMGKLRGWSEERQREGELEEATAAGLKLAGEFHTRLREFETGDLPFDRYVPVLFEELK